MAIPAFKSGLKFGYASGGGGGGTSTATTGGFDPAPAPQAGQGPYGKVPGNIGVPNRFGDLASVFPGLGAANSLASGNIMNELRGELSPETVNAIRDEAASFGVSSGMPGSGFSGNRGLRNLGLSVEGQKQQGLKDYLGAITSISGTQTVSPELQTEIATQNSINRSAPDPEAAAKREQELFDKYLEKLSKSSAGSAGGPSATWQSNPWGVDSQIKSLNFSNRNFGFGQPV